MIRDDGWLRHSIWEHSSSVRDLYSRRCRRQAEEMTCHAQAAELLTPQVSSGDTLIDAGCGSGYFFHSLAVRSIPVEYWGIDASPSLVEIGRREMPAFGLPAERLQVMRIEDLDGEVDHIVCMNVLSNIDNFHRPLERLLHCARKTVIIRESLTDWAEYAYVRDEFLDPGISLKVHVNTYPLSEVLAFIESYGFAAEVVTDRRTGGKAEMVIGYPHYWTFVVCVKKPGSRPSPAMPVNVV